MCAKQDRGSVPDPAPIRALRHRLSPFLTNDVLRSDGKAFGPMGRRSGWFLRRTSRSGRRFF